jgi:type II secretory pathway component GspD/PulD (secretin)
VRLRLLGLVLCVCAAFAAKPAEEARRLFEQGLKAERAGKYADASLLYTRASQLDPGNPMYRLRGEAAAGLAAPSKPKPDRAAPGVITVDARAVEKDRSLRPPPELNPTTRTADFDIRGSAQTLFQEVAHAYGLDCVFDGDYPQTGPTQRFQIQKAGYREALSAVQAATGSFIVPLTPKLFIVAQDTQQNRSRLEPYVSISVRIPQATSTQEMTEVAQAVQQTMAIERVGIDTQQGVFVIRGPVSKVIPARRLFEQLLHYHSQVVVEMDVLEVDRQAVRSYGLDLPNNFSAVSTGTVTGTAVKLADLARLGLNNWAFLGLTSAQLLAQMSDTDTRSLMHLELRSENGKPATFHVGERYPVLTTGYFNSSSTSSGSTYNGGSNSSTPTTTTFGTVAKPSSVAVGDFNADGISDLAVASSSGNQIAVMLGKGDGTFDDPVTYATGTTPSAIVATDLNKDGFLDLVTADSGANSVSILLGKGDGTFADATHVGVGTNPMALAVADFNDDGEPDIAVADADSNDIYILNGKGDGTFTAGTPLAAGTSPRSLVAADFNGDGLVDLAVANYTSNDLWIFLNQGNGTLLNKQTYSAGTSPSAIATGLLNSDSSLDLVVTDAGSNSLSIFLGDGTGNFVLTGQFPTGSTPVSVAIGDMNSDGIPDLVTANSGDNSASLLIGLYDGTFETPINYTVGSGPSDIVVADFNRDGFPDLLVTNYTGNDLSILLGYGTTAFHDTSGNSYNATGGQYYTPTPSFNFEDLGLALKVTPHVHGIDHVSLDLEAAVKMLSGQYLNSMPVITNRQLTSQIDLQYGQAAIVAGLLSTQDAHAISGIAGLSQIPAIGRLFQTLSTTRESTQALIVIKAHLISEPPDQFVSTPIWLGSENRPKIPD